MDLADRVIEANEKPDYDVDELGIRISDKPDYVVIRILERNRREMIENPDAGLVHNRKNHTELWKGNRELKKSKHTIYELAELDRTLRDYEIDSIWNLLLKYTYELDESKIVIDEHTYWDTEKGELCHTEERMITI